MSHEGHHAGDSTYYLIETQLLLKSRLSAGDIYSRRILWLSSMLELSNSKPLIVEP